MREARDRVRAALYTKRFELPPGRVTVNLAPADLPKESGRFDLPIAVGILVATDQVSDKTLEQLEFAGELRLSGEDATRVVWAPAIFTGFSFGGQSKA